MLQEYYENKKEKERFIFDEIPLAARMAMSEGHPLPTSFIIKKEPETSLRPDSASAGAFSWVPGYVRYYRDREKKDNATIVGREDGKKLRRAKQGLTKKKVWVEGDEGRYQATRWVKTKKEDPKREVSRERRAIKDPRIKERAATPRHLRPFKDLAEGAIISLTRMEEDAILRNSKVNPSKLERVKNLATNNDMTEVEGHALGTWGTAEYFPVNESLYKLGAFPKGLMALGEDPVNTAEYNRAIAKAAASALSKIPPITKEGVYNSLVRQQDRLDDPFLRKQVAEGVSALPDKTRRYEPFNIERFDSFKEGEEYESNAFFTTTIRQDSSFAFHPRGFEPALIFEIEADWDGTGAGKYIDEAKNVYYEGEILYPPGTRFKVESKKGDLMKEEIAIAKAKDGLNQIIAVTEAPLRERRESLRKYTESTAATLELEDDAMRKAFSEVTTLENFNQSRIEQGGNELSFMDAVIVMQAKAFPREGLPSFLQKAYLPMGEVEEKIVEAFRDARERLKQDRAYVEALQVEEQSLRELRSQLESQVSTIVEGINNIPGYTASKTGEGGFLIRSSFTEKEQVFEEMENIPDGFIKVLDQLFIPKRNKRAEFKIVLKEI